MLKTSKRASTDFSLPTLKIFDSRMSQLMNARPPEPPCSVTTSGPARNELRSNICPVAGSMDRTELRRPPRPASALNGLPVLAWNDVEYWKPHGIWKTAPSVARCLTSLGAGAKSEEASPPGPQSLARLEFVMSAGWLKKSFE